MTTAPPQESGGFLRRLGYYALGIAVGLMLLGMFQAKKQMALRAQEAESRQIEQREDSTGSTPSVEQGP
ncbi:MAG: hypothetical protein KF757_11950 [Phycisphaeraceae bacterium]|nr:hypothetical protein [Phycisphaeraceae bacterium]MCW5762405.1 hypothetical protein [Phycisphaeraceae bacterium]